MSDPVLPLFLAGCALLVVAGMPKLRDPRPLVRALRTLGLDTGPGPLRAVAALEVVLGLAGIVHPATVTGVLVAGCYLAFTGVVGLALARGGVLESCGCFGRSDTPPTRSHLAVTAAVAGAGLVVAAAG